ncbi:MAG: hypothetical protein GC206_03465 [Alphaproteobacteria bacterium]|nr:hypothetical protein [Alphaproteobacteria bacterium]
MVAVTHVLDRTEALILRDLLEGAGIKASLPDLGYIDVQPFQAFAVGGYRILVRSDQSAEATEIIAAARASAAEKPQTMAQRTNWLSTLVLSLLSAAPLPVKKTTWRADSSERRE